jgi:hypothetical protein
MDANLYMTELVTEHPYNSKPLQRMNIMSIHITETLVQDIAYMLSVLLR